MEDPATHKRVPTVKPAQLPPSLTIRIINQLLQMLTDISVKYAQERGFNVAEKVDSNEACGLMTNLGVGIARWQLLAVSLATLLEYP